MPTGWLALTLPVWFVGAILLLIRGLFRGAFRATWDGFVAAVQGLGPMLKTRRELGARRWLTSFAVAASFTWNPFAYLGRQIDVRPFQQEGPE